MKNRIEKIVAILILGLSISLIAAPISSVVTVGTSETELIAATAGASATTSFVIANTSTNNVWWKYSSATNALTSTNGIPLPPGAVASVTSTASAAPARNRITAISDSTNATVAVQSDNAK